MSLYLITTVDRHDKITIGQVWGHKHNNVECLCNYTDLLNKLQTVNVWAGMVCAFNCQACVECIFQAKVIYKNIRGTIDMIERPCD